MTQSDSVPPLTGPAPTGSRATLRRQRAWVWWLTLALGVLIFVWHLGSTGLVDETPPLFAAAARAMAETGDWLIPRVNGLPRYDKPPLVYWLMGALYALPGQALWNPLGSWAAALPSALASVAVMLGLADTLLRWPQRAGERPTQPRGAFPVLPIEAALAFALSPLVLLWGRTPVSDALFSALVALALLCFWRRYAAAGGAWWPAWALLGLAVLTKGPVALVLVALTLGLFAGLQADLQTLIRSLQPLRGLLLTALVAGPWYGLALAKEGQPFWDSFFGYHNLQRFTSVVNHHLQPWWFFVPVLLIASLPFTPLLLLGLARAIGPLEWGRPPRPMPAPLSLGRFCACWLLAVLGFFTAASTKLPSYWLPAVPAAAVLIALTARVPAGHGGRGGPDRASRWAWWATLLLTALIAAVFFAGPWLVSLIRDPELPTLPAELIRSGRLPVAGVCWLAAALLGWLVSTTSPSFRGRLLALQLPLVLFVPLALLPSWGLGDRLRGEPVRTLAATIQRQARPGEPLAMVGILKPSLHYYSRRVVIYEGIQPSALRNLSDRLSQERRQGLEPSSSQSQPTVLVVIDQRTAQSPHWRDLAPVELGQAGLYRLWRLDRRRLEARAQDLAAAGVPLEWRRPVPERY